MSNLYEINNGLQMLLAQLEEDDLPQNVQDLIKEGIKSISLSKEDKLINIHRYIKSLESEVSGIEKEQERLKNLCQVKKNKIASLIKYVSEAGLEPGEKFDKSGAVFSWRKSTAVVIEDEEKIPTEMIRVKTITEVDKALVKDALKSGVRISGAHLIEKMNLQIK